MKFNQGEPVRRKSNGEKGTVTVQPPMRRSAPAGYVWVEFEVALGAVPVYSEELERVG